MKLTATVLCACLLAVPVATTAAPEASIDKVAVHVGAANDVSKGVNSPQGRYLPKFFDTVEGAMGTVDVRWSCPDGGLPADGSVVLEYVEKVGGPKQRLSVPVKRGMKGLQHTTFSLPKVGSPETARLAAWRVRLVVAGRAIAERSSEGWK